MRIDATLLEVIALPAPTEWEVIEYILAGGVIGMIIAIIEACR
jgi:hypothetical protein